MTAGRAICQTVYPPTPVHGLTVGEARDDLSDRLPALRRCSV